MDLNTISEISKSIEDLRDKMFESECLDAVKLLGVNGIYNKMMSSFNPNKENQSSEHYKFVRIYNHITK